MNARNKLIAVAVSSCACCSLPVIAHASSSTALEVEIQPKECTLDFTISGMQPSTTINPSDCSRRLFLPSSFTQPQDNLSIDDSPGLKIHLSSSSPASRKKPPSPIVPPPANTHRTPAAQSNRQVFLEAGIVIIVAASTDALVFNLRFTQIAWRQLVRAWNISNLKK